MANVVSADQSGAAMPVEHEASALPVEPAAGQERFASLVSAYFRGCHGVVLVFDLSKRNSFERVQPWLERAKEHAQEDVEVLVVGNKSDLEPEVSREEAEELATTLQAAYVETSAKCDEASVVGAFESLAQRILEHRPCGGGYAYGPPPEPAYTYRPPPHLPGLPVNGPRSCCHFLGPPGNAYHEGSHSDRGDIMERSKTLEEIVSLSPTALAPFAAALYAARPAVLRGAAAAWSGAWAALQPSALAARFGQRRVPVAQLREGRSVPPFQCRSMELQTFLASLRGDDATRRNLYLQQLPVLQHLPELEQLQVPVPIMYARRSVISMDTKDNLFLQLSGRKRFRLFRPCDHDRLYARGAADPSAPHVSRVDTWGSSEARSFEVELGPGDALLLPRWWWHQSEALSDGHAINWWFEPKRAKVAAERQKEEQRAKNEETEAKAIGSEVEEAENELHQEITKLNVQIFQEKQKAKSMEKAVQNEQLKYRQELKEKELRDQQVQNLTAMLTGKDQAMNSLEGRYRKLQRKALAAKKLLEKEEKKAKLQELLFQSDPATPWDLAHSSAQELSAQQQLEAEEKKAEKKATEESLQLQEVKKQLKEEGEKAQKAFDEQVKLMQKKHAKEVKEQEEKIGHQVKIERGRVMEKVAQLEKELKHEKDISNEEAALAAQKEEELREELRRTKEEEDQKVEEYHGKVSDLEVSLEKQRQASSQKVKVAKAKLQKLQSEVISEEEALTSKKAELSRVEKEAQAMEAKAKSAEASQSAEEKHLQAKLKAAATMERRGMTALQRQAEHQAAQLRKMIADEKQMEQEQVAALEHEIREAKASPKVSQVVKVHAKFLRA
eukprot:g29124.t2